MKANELRIGNLVMGNIPFFVEAKHIVMAEMQEKAGNGQRFEPILLAEDLLVLVGFEKHNWEYDEDASPQNNGDSLFTHITEEGLYISFGRDPMCCVYGYGGIAYIYSVHQLQNLWFALFRKELTINI